MTVMVIAITDPSPAFDHKSQEIDHVLRVLDVVKQEIGKTRGTVTSGTILSYNQSNVSPSALGSWTYTPTASLP